jgi:hypothetical protein
MSNEWRPFRRNAHPSHILEIKTAEGGESYGHPDMNFRAEKGQWLCRNIETGYRWVVSNAGIVQLYTPVGHRNEKLESLIAKSKEKSKSKKKNTKPSKKKAPAKPTLFSRRRKK